MEKISIEGFHGTFRSKANKILKHGFTYSYNQSHWLGQGIYFYKDYYLARWWIDKKIEKKKIDDLGEVIKADIIVDKNKLIDLDDSNDLDSFFEFVKTFLKKAEESGLNITLEKGKEYEIRNRCFMLDMMKKHKNIVVVKSTFTKNDPTYGNYNIKKFEKDNYEFGLSYKETQICVSSNEYILNKEIVN